jgi:hypothetical protein
LVFDKVIKLGLASGWISVIECAGCEAGCAESSGDERLVAIIGKTTKIGDLVDGIGTNFRGEKESDSATKGVSFIDEIANISTAVNVVDGGTVFVEVHPGI